MTNIGGGLCITPPTSAKIEKFNNICIDWLNITWQFTDIFKYKNTKILEDIAKIFNVTEIEVIQRKFGGYGYKYGWDLGTEIKYYEGLQSDPALNIFSKMIQLSGSSCRDLEDRNVNIVDVFDYIKFTGGKITRFDLAYDDFYCDNADLKKIYDYMYHDNFVSTFKKWFYRLGFENGKYSEHAITCGSKTSSVELQIYDKLLERLVNYNVDVDFVKDWIRYEIRYFKGKANTQFDNYISLLKGNSLTFKNKYDEVVKIIDNGNIESNIIEFYFTSLFEILDIKEPGKNEQKTRWKTADWWLRFLGEKKRIKIRNQYLLESDITTKKSWVKRSVLKPIAKIKQAIGQGFDDKFKELVDQKTDELDIKDKNEINSYKDFIKSTGELDDWFN